MNAKEAAFRDMVEEGLTISVFAQEKTILELTRTISIDDVEVEITEDDIIKDEEEEEED